jgi:hypothetical protein
LKEDFGARGIGLTHQGDGRNLREVPGQVVQLLERRPAALPDGEEDGVDRTLPDHADDIR